MVGGSSGEEAWCEGLTAKILEPHCSLGQVDVVQREEDVDALIYEKDVPRLRGKAGVPKADKGEDHDWERDDEAGRGCDPSKQVQHTATITLYNRKQLIFGPLKPKG